LSYNELFLSLGALQWTALSAVGTLLVAVVAVIPIGAAMHMHLSRRRFLRKRLHAQLIVLQTKLKQVIAARRWNTFAKEPFETIHRTNFDTIEYLFHASAVLPPAEQDRLLDFVVYFKTSKNMRSHEDFAIMADHVDRLLRLFPQKARRSRK
jgi:hypothetical protein